LEQVSLRIIHGSLMMLLNLEKDLKQLLLMQLQQSLVMAQIALNGYEQLLMAPLHQDQSHLTLIFNSTQSPKSVEKLLISHHLITRQTKQSSLSKVAKLRELHL
jgi:hypothetical protein